MNPYTGEFLGHFTSFLWELRFSWYFESWSWMAMSAHTVKHDQQARHLQVQGGWEMCFLVLKVLSETRPPQQRDTRDCFTRSDTNQKFDGIMFLVVGICLQRNSESSWYFDKNFWTIDDDSTTWVHLLFKSSRHNTQYLGTYSSGRVKGFRGLV